jgi:type II secretory pathway component PulF
MALAAPSAQDLSFKYTAVDRTGKQVRDVVRARDARAAARALVAEGLTPISVRETQVQAKGGKTRELSFSEKVLVLRQLALMVEAGVGLLEAMETVTPGIVAIKGRMKMEGVIVALKRGENFAHALETQAPGFPFYVYAMCRVGEATGKLADVLKEAAEQMAFEDRLRKDFVSAMIYPAFLMVVGAAVVTAMMVKVLPAFKGMIGDNRDKLPLLSAVMFDISDLLTAHLVQLGIGLAVVIVLLVAGFSNKTVRTNLYAGAREAPIIGSLFKAREITAWARLLGFGLTSGVNLLEAAALARIGAPNGPFKEGLEQFERDLKSGVSVADSLSRHTELTAMDLSLLRAGQKSGTMPRMFLYVAETYDSRLRDQLKRISALVEPITIALIAVSVALLALAIVMAMLTLYQNIG